MKKLIAAMVLGGVVGFATSASVSNAATTSCGTLTCTAHQECCVSPAPITYRCVKAGTCPYNK